MKINDGSNWQEAKDLKINTGSGFVAAKKAYVYNNGWQLAYPNLPQSLGTPTFTHTGTTYRGQVGAVLTVSSLWKSEPAYAPASYTYQWKRGSSPISGATSQTYTAAIADVDQILSCTVTAINGRGNVSVTGDIGTIILPTISSINASDITAIPTQPSVSISNSGLSYSGSWTASSNATSYSVTTDNGSVTDNGNRTFSGSGSAGNVSVTITPINTNKQVYVYWTAAPGAVSYDVVKYGNNVETIINVPSNQLNYTWSIADGNEGNYFSVYPRSANYQGYGIQTSLTVSNKYGTSGSASTSIGCSIGYITDWTYGGLTWGGNCVNNSEAGTYSYRYATYRNSDCTTQDIYEYGSYSTSRYCVPTCTAGWVDADYTYNNITWSGTCGSNSLEGGTSAGRTRTYRYADCSTAVITEQGPFYQTRSCTYVNCSQCNSYSGQYIDSISYYTCTSSQAYYKVCYTPVGCDNIIQFQSCYYPPAATTWYCTTSSPGAGVGNCSYSTSSSNTSGSGTGYSTSCSTSGYPACQSTAAALSGKGTCLSYDVTNSASAFYYDCYSVGQCNTHTTNNRTPC
jgi:hypothetical protein